MKSVDGGNEGGIAFGGRGVSDTHTHKTLIFFFTTCISGQETWAFVILDHDVTTSKKRL